MSDPIPLSLIARFSGDARIYTAFGYFIAAGNGYLLMVPEAAAFKDCEIQAISGCPVPVEEVSAILYEPWDLRFSVVASEKPLLAKLATLGGADWRYDLVPVMPGAWRKVLRAVNDNGIRYAEVVR